MSRQMNCRCTKGLSRETPWTLARFLSIITADTVFTEKKIAPHPLIRGHGGCVQSIDRCPIHINEFTGDTRYECNSLLVMKETQ
jgi:hypothetical protein